jgi:predicted transcriptional regulator/DNA-binding XRE family transcriptional regulator
MSDSIRVGKRIRALRLRLGLTQGAMAERLAVSPSYLNLLEHDRRGLTSALLLKLARVFDIDVRTFAEPVSEALLSDTNELFAEPLFEDFPLTTDEVRGFVESYPDVARAVVRLHQAYDNARGIASSIAERVLGDEELAGLDVVRLSSEQVSDFVERWQNHFSELESEAEALRASESLETETLFEGLSRHLVREYGVTVRILPVGAMGGLMRRYDPKQRVLDLSETLRRGSRNFQAATQIGLLRCGAQLDALTRDPMLTSVESRTLCRIALAGYFAGAVLMPYREFLAAAEALRYDIQLIEHRFRVSFEQVCHRLTSLHRPGAEGIPFYFVRVDLAGNISKKFGTAGIRFPRFSGLCTLWNVTGAFLQPGRIRTQMSRLPDGTAVFAIACTVERHAGGFHAPQVLHAIGVGCDLASAQRIVYADGMDLSNVTAAVPIGITCRSCERVSCQARAFPALERPLKLDVNVRGPSFFAPIDQSEG